jgi:uncharacterized lipoprotein YmbA
MKTSPLVKMLLVVGAAGFIVGCSFLRPTGVTPRSFVLTSLPAVSEPIVPSSTRAVGMGFVRLPAYLFPKSMAMRQGANEVVYLETALWAERLDRGLQRVIAANLATLMPGVQVRLSPWRSAEISAEIYVTVEQFEVDVRGQCTLNASWRIVAPGGAELWKAGPFHAVRQGAAPDLDPEGATVSMSALAAELSRVLAEAVELGSITVHE